MKDSLTTYPVGKIYYMIVCIPMGDWTDLQEKIIRKHKRNSDKSDAEIAAEFDCSASYVNQTRNEYEEKMTVDLA
jgi:hypothetical protein